MKTLIAAAALAALVVSPALARKAHHPRGVHRAQAATVVYGSASYGPAFRSYSGYYGRSRNFQDQFKMY